MYGVYRLFVSARFYTVFVQNVQGNLPNVYQKQSGGLPTVYQAKARQNSYLRVGHNNLTIISKNNWNMATFKACVKAKRKDGFLSCLYQGNTPQKGCLYAYRQNGK